LITKIFIDKSVTFIT